MRRGAARKETCSRILVECTRCSGKTAGSPQSQTSYHIPQSVLAPTTTVTGVDMNRDGLPNVLQQPQIDPATTTVTGVNVSRDSLPNVLQQPQIDLATTSVTGVDMNRDGLPNVLQQPQIDLATTTVTVVDLNRDGLPDVLQQLQCGLAHQGFDALSQYGAPVNMGMMTVKCADMYRDVDPNVLQQPLIGTASSQICEARSSRDGFTADLECDGTHYNFPMTHESGEAVEDLTKDEVEHLVTLLRDVVDVLCRQEVELYLMLDMMIDQLISGDTEEIASDARLAISQIHEFWCRRTQHYDIAVDDSDSDQGGAWKVPVHGTPSRYATACCNRSVHWPRVRPHSLPADRHSDPSCDYGALMYPGEDEESDHDSYLAGRSGLCLVCEENLVYALTLSCPTQCSLCEDCGMYMLWCEGCRHFTCRRGRRVVLWQPGLSRRLTASTHPVPSPIPLGALGGGDGGGRWVGRRGTHIPAEWMVLCRGVYLRAEAPVLLERSFAHLFLKRVAVDIKHQHFTHNQHAARIFTAVFSTSVVVSV